MNRLLLRPMTAHTYNVLFLCTGNSARSILAERLLMHLGQGRFTGFSAGSHPTGRVNPLAVDTLEAMGLPVDNLRSKSWDEYAAADAPSMDFIVTVCDQAAGESCPVWPGHPALAHWGIPDPAAVTGDHATRLAAFRKAALTLEWRIRLLVALPDARLAASNAKLELQQIAETLPL